MISVKKYEKPDQMDKIVQAIVADQFDLTELIKMYGSDAGVKIANILSAGELRLMTKERVIHLIRNQVQFHIWEEACD
ncbi:MAG: hypothetical protein O7G87_16615 [bacterium]|nr:hypothetical protein [bacterium]